MKHEILGAFYYIVSEYFSPYRTILIKPRFLIRLENKIQNLSFANTLIKPVIEFYFINY